MHCLLSYLSEVSHICLLPPSLLHVRHDSWGCLIIVTYHISCLLSHPCEVSHICLLPLSLSHVGHVVYFPIPVTCVFYSPIPVTCQTFVYSPIPFTWELTLSFHCDVSQELSSLTLWRITYLFTPHPCHMSDMTLDAVLLLWRITYLVYSSIPVTCHIFIYTPSLSHNRCLVVSILSVTCHMCYFLYPSHLSDMSFTFLSLWHVILLSLWRVSYLFTPHPCHATDV